jgi:hypothetical protein
MAREQQRRRRQLYVLTCIHTFTSVTYNFSHSTVHIHCPDVDAAEQKNTK